MSTIPVPPPPGLPIRTAGTPNPALHERWARKLLPDELAGLANLSCRPLLAPVLPCGSLMLLQGPRGVGLTQVMVGCAVAIATGGRFLGWNASGPARVLLLSGAMSAGALGVRINAALQVVEGRVGLADRLDLVAFSPQTTRLPNLASDLGQDELEALAEPCAAVLIDDLASLLPGEGLDSRQAMYLRQCLARLRGAGKALIVSQASGRQGQRRAETTARGALQALADVVADLSLPDDHALGDGCRFTLRFERARHLVNHQRTPIEARLGERSDGKPVWTVVKAGATPRQRFEATIDSGLPVAAAGRELGIALSTAYRWLGDLRAARAAPLEENGNPSTARPPA